MRVGDDYMNLLNTYLCKSGPLSQAKAAANRRVDKILCNIAKEFVLDSMWTDNREERCAVVSAQKGSSLMEKHDLNR